MLTLASSIIKNIEQSAQSLIRFIGGALFFILARNTIEMFATGQDISYRQVFTYSPFYVGLVVWLIWYFHVVSKRPVVQSAKVVLVFYALILLPPFIDMTFSQEVRMRYLGISDWNSFIKNLATFGMADEGISWGQRIEIILAAICGGFYFKVTTGSTFKAIVFGYGVYLWIFLFGLMLQIMSKIFGWLHAMPVEDEWQLAKWYFLISLAGFLLLAYRHNKYLFTQLLRDSRPLRILHFLLSCSVGFLLYYNAGAEGETSKFILTTENVMIPLLTVISVVFAAVFSIVTNNLEDIEVDKISNTNRPTLHAQFNRASYAKAGNVALFISLLAAYLAGRPVLVCMGVIIGMYYVYSCKPFRLKTIPVFSKMVIGINSFFMALMGYTLFGETALTFPQGFMLFYLVAVSLAANFIDLKDVKGDAAAGIKTLPVLIGMRNAQYMIALFTLCTYALAYYLLQLHHTQIIWTVMLGANATAHLFFLVRKNYVELPVMVFHTFSMVGMNIILLYA